ncbi:ABC transporter permease [Desulfopila sp. IMCC35006]|uniref:ABC transporter permease n=1 Tax=Desulfopila sp. IMCC35006 TaxID=2569542 RepID=UPI0010AB88C1|nr:ABC transporter permease [Desulfopila sp. IMCC35006]TKB26951.1 ABC transporter permease [Desulfopila sp. IMCC35006]
MDFSIIAGNIDIYLEGLKNTLILVTISLAFGLIFAIPLAVLRTSGNQYVQAPIRAFVYFFRGTPLLVQMFLVYYGFGQFDLLKESFLWPLFKEAYFCALFTFSLNTCAYTTEIFRGAIVATPHGEIEAARAAGMSTFLMLRRIVLPSAFRRALPAYSNEIIFMLHGSALASVITIIDITGAARIVNSRFYSPYEAFLTAAAFYMTITFTFVFLIRRLEKRWHGHLQPADQSVTKIEAPV